MPTIEAEQLEDLGRRIFVAVRTPDAVARYVAHSLVTNNLLGHDSHGFFRILSYLEHIRQGTIRPAARPEIINESDTTALISGNWAFGQVSAKFAAEVAIRKAMRANVAAVGVVKLTHAGRIGEFAELIARAGMFGMVVLGGSRDAKGVAPFGGKQAIFDTNPYAFALPAGKRPIVVADFATTVMAVGKLQVARAKGEPLPHGVILDKEGHPSTNPDDFFRGGLLLPMGRHKGYAMALVAELLAAPFIGCDVYGAGPRAHGAFMLAVNVEAFRPLAGFCREADALLSEVKAIPPADGFDEVLIPGEPEFRAMARRKQSGIFLPEETWQQLVQVAKELGVDARLTE